MSTSPIRFGVIGCGHWGPNFVRNLQLLPETTVLQCADLSEERLNHIKTYYPTIEVTTDAKKVLSNPAIDAVIIATPASTHFPLVKQALELNKDVLCEKPLTLNLSESQQLIELAERQKKILMVGHTFLFNTGIQQLKSYIQEGYLGQIYYLQSTRTNLGPIRSDVNAVMDLASHDLSIYHYLLEGFPESICAQGQAYLQPGIEDLAFISCQYPNQILAQIHVSWLNPVKVRQITIVGSKRMVVWDDLNLAEPIRIYDASVKQEQYYNDFGQFHLLTQRGATTIPALKLQEPLKNEVQAFVKAIKTRESPLSDGHFSVGVVKLLQACQQSLKNSGQMIKL